ncbi:MAG: Flp pilus assembly protein CpaB [Alphaproteobacteria bacterium]
MRARFILLLGVNIMLVIGVIFFTRTWLAGQEVGTEPVVVATVAQDKDIVHVLTASADLSPGVLIKESHLQWQQWPKKNLAETYFQKDVDAPDEVADAAEENVLGGVVRYGLAEGQPIIPGAVVKPGDRGFLAAILDPDKRAVSIPVSAAAGGAGLILPGDRVDVILTQQVELETIEGDPVRRHASETILSDIRVIAFDQSVSGDPEDPSVARTATLEVTPRQGEILALSGELGRLSMSLRSIQGSNKTVRRGATWDHHASVALTAPSDTKQSLVPEVVRGGGAEK